MKRDGVIKVGLDHCDLENLAKSGHESVKASRRDVALLVAQRLTGSTTVRKGFLRMNKETQKKKLFS